MQKGDKLLYIYVFFYVVFFKGSSLYIDFVTKEELR